jgi:hypothetical protein|tara:strand:+ start:27 stop:536 length:510 start_codon:yes stop_codon:yes gene_type:complete
MVSMPAKKEHDLNRYNKINALTTDNPMALVEKIREVPEDYERYRFFLCEIDQDPALNLSVIEMSRVASMLMQLEKYDGWSYDKSVEELAMFESTNERTRKMNEYILNYLMRAKAKDTIGDSVGAAKQILMELKGEDGNVTLEWKKKPEIIDITEEINEVKEDDEQHNDK